MKSFLILFLLLSCSSLENEESEESVKPIKIRVLELPSSVTEKLIGPYVQIVKNLYPNFSQDIKMNVDQDSNAIILDYILKSERGKQFFERFSIRERKGNSSEIKIKLIKKDVFLQSKKFSRQYYKEIFKESGIILDD